MATKKVILKEIVDGVAGDSMHPETSIDMVEGLEEALDAAGSVSTISVNNGTPIQPVNKNINITVPEGTITGIVMNGASKGTSGVVDLGTVVTDISGKQDTISNVTVAVDANIGTPAGTVTFSNNTLAFNFQNLKGVKGDTGSQGPKGETGDRGPVGANGVTTEANIAIITGIDTTTQYDSTKDVASAEAVQDVLKTLSVNKDLTDDEKVIVAALTKHEEKIAEMSGDDGSSSGRMGENEALVISSALNDLNSRCKSEESEESSSFPVKGKLTIANSEKISVLGSSFGTGSFNMAGKNWVAKLSLFSDYQFENLSKDGFNYTQLLRYIRLGQITFNGKYALLCDNENSSMNMNDRLRSLINIATYLKSYGAIPIIATSYADMPYESALWLDYSEKNNFMMWDAAQYCAPIRGARNTSWDSARHLGTRNSQMVTDAFMPYMIEMEKPRMSMKVFRLRDGISYSNLDNIMFFDNIGRAEKYRELLLGVQAISDNTKVDDIQNAGLRDIANEYRSLASNGLVFNTPVLISAVLPLYAENISHLNISLTSTNDVKVYCMNRLIRPYPEIGSYARFSIPSLISTPSQNAVYSVNGTNYTVKAVVMGENDYYCTIYCSPSLGSSISAGTMTKVSGSGDSSIPFAIGEDSTLNESGVVTSDSVGHWEELTQSNGTFNVNNTQIKACVEIDTIHFLVVPQSGETFLSNISVDYAGDILKPASTRRYYKLDDTYRNDGELITEPTFGATGSTTSEWKNDNGNSIVSETDYENKYPTGCSSIVKVDDTTAINYTVPSSAIGNGGWYALEVWSRYFPPIYTDGSGNQITPNSYDYETLNVRISNVLTPSNTNNYSTLQDVVGTYWKRSIFKFSIFTSDQLTIRVSAGAKGIEVCKVSLKKIK